MKELHEALAKARAEFLPIARDKNVTVTMKSGARYTFSYAPLENLIAAVTPALSKHGIAFYQDVQDGFVVTCLGIGEDSLRLAPFPLGLREGMTMQERGSCVTYASRYSMRLALALPMEDDDDANITDGNESVNMNLAPKISPVRSSAAELDAESISHVQQVADEILKALAKKDDKAVFELSEGLDSDQRVYLWSIWQDDSKLRSRVKAIVSTFRQIAAQAAPEKVAA